ncbi:hypothetical protein Tco_0035297, partial [Tanacetum coccineum]
KLVPKSNPHTGDCNVVPLDVADRVLDVNSNVPAKRQRANGSGFISPLLIDVGPSGVQNVPPVGGPALRVSVIKETGDWSMECIDGNGGVEKHNDGTRDLNHSIEHCDGANDVVKDDFLVRNESSRSRLISK